MERIELTDEDVHDVAAAAWSPLPDHPEDLAACFGTVREVVAAVNRVRVGDPVGTIRRCPEGHVAVRISSDRSDREMANWAVTFADGRQAWRLLEGVKDWPAVYSPGESA